MTVLCENTLKNGSACQKAAKHVIGDKKLCVRHKNLLVKKNVDGINANVEVFSIEDCEELNDIPVYRTNKITLKNIIKHDANILKINETAIKANNIVIHGMQFIKAYMIRCYEDEIELPHLDSNFVDNVLRVICGEKKETRGKKIGEANKKLQEPLIKFYKKYYESTMYEDEILDYQLMNTILDYLAVTIETNFNNNLIAHFVEYVERYVNVKFNKDIAKQTMSETEYKTFLTYLRTVKTAIIDPTIVLDNFTNDDVDEFLRTARRNIMPQRPLKNNILYDLKCNPQDYLKGSIYMMKEIEELDKKIYNVFPTRNDIAPKHFRLDTTTLIQLMFGDDKRKGKFLTGGRTKRCAPYLWRRYFRTELKLFKKTGYLFNHQIVTDGISCSIIFIRTDQFGKRCKRGAPKLKYPESYINELPNPLLDKLSEKTLVTFDPNMADLLYGVSFSDRTDITTRKHIRYTQNQRRKECKTKKYAKILLEMKKSVINGSTITEHETTLSAYNRKTLNFKKYMKYVEAKNTLNHHVSAFYEQQIHRKLKHQGFVNRRKSEQKFINSFVKMFGTPENVVITIGDWEQKRHMKYKEPVKGKGYRRAFRPTMFRKVGYSVYLVDEHKTSCMCNRCENRLETFRQVKNPRPYRGPKGPPVITCKGLLRCKFCSALWNRDENAARNQFDISHLAIRGDERPDYLRRGLT